MPSFKKKYVYAGRYQLAELIGEGGFSEVWRASDAMTDDAVVALKIYAPERGLDEYGIKQFRKEYAIAFNLSHPHLMRVLHFDICHGSPYLIMPYLPHGSISKYLQSNPPLTIKQIAAVMFQIGGALAELHSQQPPILHQDIKPDNILVRKPDYFILSDFGISYQTRHTLTKATGSIHSLTIAYSPPERFSRHPESTEASDVFSFGVSLYEMCTGIVPWEGSGGQSLLKGAEIPDLPSNFPSTLNRILHRCMSATPSERPTAEQLSELGRHFLEKGVWKFVEPGRRPTRSKVLIALATLMVVAMVSLGLIYIRKPVTSMDKTAQSDTPPTDTTKAISSVIPDSGTKSNIDSVRTKQEQKAEPHVESTQLTKTDQPQQKRIKVPKSFVIASIGQYLTMLSDQSVSIVDRSKVRSGVLSLFSGSDARIIERNGATYVSHIPSVYLDFLMDSLNNVKVVDVVEDQNHRIVKLTLDVVDETQL
ncbi:serine/threonine-protein kinase [Chryseolinea sp. T2]|uniref:serine/threonine protein kinase n=1 Tax=Chryseolinea sp. T2 TaxID=3129255 RepID=UPI00307776BF